MKRKPGEIFYDYCARRLLNQELTKLAMKPRFVHVSCVIVPNPSDEYKDTPKEMRPLVKVRAQGTYIKPKKGGADAVR